MKVKDAVPLYMEKIKATSKKQATLKYYKQYFRFICNFIGDLEIEKITKFDVTRMINRKIEQSPNISNASLNKYIQTIQTLYKYITDKPLNMRKLKEPKCDIPTIDPEIIDIIFQHYEERLDVNIKFRNYIYFRLALDTGLRKNELVNLEIEKINLDLRYIYVTTTKTDVNRYVVFSEKTAMYLKKFLLVHHNGGKYLFINFYTGKRIATSTIGSMVQKLRKELKLDDRISSHLWRHTFATTYIRKGGQTHYLQKYLGHSNLRTTQKYLHPTKEDILEHYIDIH